MKRLISILLALALILCSCSFSFAASQNKVFQTLKALRIMNGDSSGNMNETANLTRAEFAKMLVAASGDSSTSTDGKNFSLYTDVSKTHWARGYIYKATAKGYLSGYTDSSFRPDNNVKLEEVCAGVIKLLGFSAKDLSGSFPYSYLDKADELGLLNNVSAVKGQYITRLDCANLFYNALLATNAGGKVYGTTIGCTVNNGLVSYTAPAEKSSTTDGIYVGVVNSITYETSASSNTGVASTVTILCTDGTTRSFEADRTLTYSSGQLIQVTVTNSAATFSGLNEKSISGTVSPTGKTVGEYSIAEDVGILDCDSYGNAEIVDLDDIKGRSLSSGTVRYYSLNANGKIDTLVLNDVTGALWDKVYMTSVVNNSSGMNLSGTYTYISDGKTNTTRTSDKLYGVEAGGALIKTDTKGEAQAMKNMSHTSLSTLTSTEAMYVNTKFNVDDEVQVYICSSGEYYLSDVDTVNDGQFRLVGWYLNEGNTNNIYIVIATRISN